MIKCSVEFNKELVKELNGKVKLGSLISMIIGIVGLCAYITISMFIEAFWLEVFLWVFAIMFGFGLVFFLKLDKINNETIKSKIINEYELNEEFMNVTSIKNGEAIGTSKIYYKDLVKVKETNNFLFLYPNNAQAFAISKKISTEELSLLKVWVHSAKIKK